MEAPTENQQEKENEIAPTTVESSLTKLDDEITSLSRVIDLDLEQYGTAIGICESTSSCLDEWQESVRACIAQIQNLRRAVTEAMEILGIDSSGE